MKTKLAQKMNIAGMRLHPAKPQAGPSTPAIEPRWNWHFQTLLALRERLMQEAGQKLKDAAQPIEAHSMHPGDSATDEFEHDVALTLLAREENALRDVNDALARILEGRYGVCEISGVTIPAARLRALPWCRYSLQAEQQLERLRGGGKCRVPDVFSLRGAHKDIPQTGTITPRQSEGPADDGSDLDKEKRKAEKFSPGGDEVEATEDAAETEAGPER